MSQISRIIFNFTSKCNLPCKFCYIPFDQREARDILLWKRIVDRCKAIGAEVITFGGGDPFMYNQFIDLLEYSFDATTFLQIDTNALSMHKKYIPAIARCANLVGLPLEGNEKIHNQMRGHDRHHAIVVKWLKHLLAENVPIKINTVVTKQNASSILELADFLGNYQIAKWSIYQFWALSAGRENRDEYEVSEGEYSQLVKNIESSYPSIKLEASTAKRRHNSYFFVSHTARVYVMKHDNQEEYIDIGSIFDSDIVDKWELHGSHDALLRRTLLRKLSA